MKLNSDTLSNIAAALVKAQSEMGNATKDSKNPFFKSSYADLNAVREAVLPACNANGISVLQPTVVYESRKYVQTMLLHVSGEFISGLTEILSVKELDAQAQGSGVSYARRYGLQSIANVGAEDDDGNSASGKNAPAQRPSQSAPRSLTPAELSKDDPRNAPAAGSKPAAQSQVLVGETAPAKKSFRTAKGDL